MNISMNKKKFLLRILLVLSWPVFTDKNPLSVPLNSYPDLDFEFVFIYHISGSGIQIQFWYNISISFLNIPSPPPPPFRSKAPLKPTNGLA